MKEGEKQSVRRHICRVCLPRSRLSSWVPWHRKESSCRRTWRLSRCPSCHNRQHTSRRPSNERSSWKSVYEGLLRIFCRWQEAHPNSSARPQQLLCILHTRIRISAFFAPGTNDGLVKSPILRHSRPRPSKDKLRRESRTC